MGSNGDGYWSKSVGEHGNTVRVRERKWGGNVILIAWDSELGKEREKSLGFKIRDKDTGTIIPEKRDRAISAAKAMSRRKHEGDALVERAVTLGQLDRKFREVEVPQLPSDQRRRIVTSHLDGIIHGWDRLGPSFPALEFGPSDWKAWIRGRHDGFLDSGGQPVPEPEDPEGERSGVKLSTVAFELASLKQLFGWGTTYRVSGEFLLEVNPTRGLSLPKNPDPSRPVASDDKYLAILAEMKEMEMSVGSGAERRKVTAHAYPLTVVCGECGVRVGEACHLKWSDWRAEDGPHGALDFRGIYQKNGQSRTILVTARVREALEEHRQRFPGVGEAWMFPAPRSDGPVRVDVARDWWLDAEKAAGFPHPDQGGFHELRRRWASKRKHLSPVDVSKVGGWKDIRTMQKSYQQADRETQERVMLLEDDDPSSQAAG